MEEDIQFNVEAKFKSLDDLEKKLQDIEKQFKDFSKIKISDNIQKQIKSITSNIENANKSLDLAQKNVTKAQDKLFKAKLSGDGNKIISAEKELVASQNDLLSIVKVIKESENLNKQIQQTKKDYDFQKNVESKINNARDSLKKLELSLDPTKKKLVELQAKLEQARLQFIKLNYAEQDTKGAESSIKRLTKQIENTRRATKKTSSSWQTLMNRIKNISIYRIIRTGLHWITQGLQEGINNLVQYDDSANKTMSNLNASLNQIKNTMGIAFASVLQSLEPVITKVADLLVDLVNSFNLAMAKMQGKNVYTKAKKNVDDYAKSLKSAKKLSFDTFEVLSGDGGKTQPFEMFEETSVSEDANELSNALESVLKIIQKIWDVIKKIFTVFGPEYRDLFAGIISIIDPLLDIVGIIIDLLTPAIKLVANITINIVKYFSGVAKIIAGILKLLTGDFKGFWEYVKSGFEDVANSILNIFKNLIKQIFDSNILKPLNWLRKIFGNDSFKMPKFNSQFSPRHPIQGFVDGGIPAKSELFYMNENGIPETLVNTGGSQTNVINQQQLKQLVRDGFIEAKQLMGDDSLILSIKGTDINDNAFARAIFPALKVESTRRGGNQL